jgi:hypothetical protein
MTQPIETLSAAQQSVVRTGIGLATAPRLIFAEDFTGSSYNTTVLKAFNGATLTFDAANDRLSVTADNNGRGVLLDDAALGLVAGEWYIIEAQWSGNCAIDFVSAWSNANVPRTAHVNQNMVAVHAHRQSTTGTGSNHSPIIRGVAVAYPLTWQLLSVKVWQAPPGVVFPKGTNSSIVIGTEYATDSSAPTNGVIIGNRITSTGTADRDVLIGNGVINSATSTSSLANVAIGSGADLATVSGGNTNQARVAVGNLAKAGSWRATAIGSHAQALATSATVVGNGSVSQRVHGDVFGRGGFLASALSDNITIIANTEVYLSNPFHRCDLPPSGISISESDGTVTPSSVECVLHGKDARDIRATPSDVDIAGGHLALVAGRGTGTGVGGKVRIKTAPAGGSSGGTQGTLVTAIEVDAVATGGSDETRFLLLDLTDGTLKRVSFGADDSAGTGFKVLRVAN